MTKMALIKWLLVLFMGSKTVGWRLSNYSVGEQIMKKILESCDKQNSFPNPVVIFGVFNTLIEGVSIIRINDFHNPKNYKEQEFLKFKANSVVLMSEPPERLLSQLERLRGTIFWNKFIPFFIIGENTAPCTNSRSILRAMNMMEIRNSIYICPNMIHNRPEIYTMNPIANYAPYPWTVIDEPNYLNIFRQNFDANISCTHLTYDKTKTFFSRVLESTCPSREIGHCF